MKAEVIIGIVILGIVAITMVAKDINDIIKSRHEDNEIDNGECSL